MLETPETLTHKSSTPKPLNPRFHDLYDRLTNH